jgi:hypothetical protein
MHLPDATPITFSPTGATARIEENSREANTPLLHK